MADYPLPNPQLPFGQQAVSPVAQTNPLMSLQQGGVQGFSLGLQARQQAMLQQQQQMEMEQQKQKAIKDQVETIRAYGELHDKYSDVPSMQKKLIINGIIPAQNKLADVIGYGPNWHIDPNDINFDEDKDSLKEMYSSANLLAQGKITPEQHFQTLRTIQEHHAGSKKVISEVEKQFDDALRQEQLKSVQENRANLNADRDEARSLRLDTQKREIVSRFNSDPLVRKHQQALDFSSEVKNYANSGNPIAAAAIPTFMARASGEVGNLSEADKKPFGGTRSILGRMSQSMQQMATGKLTEENRIFINQMADLMEKSANSNMDTLAKARSSQYSKASPSFKEDEIFSSLRPNYQTPGTSNPDATAQALEALRSMLKKKP